MLHILCKIPKTSCLQRVGLNDALLEAACPISILITEEVRQEGFSVLESCVHELFFYGKLIELNKANSLI